MAAPGNRPSGSGRPRRSQEEERNEVELPVVVVGAGAAGLTAAIWAAGRKRPVILLEATDKPGQKILISGGGRCNVLPSRVAASDFFTSGSPNTLSQDPGWLVAGRGVPVLREVPARPAGAGAGDRQGVPRLQPGSHRARRAARIPAGAGRRAPAGRKGQRIGAERAMGGPSRLNPARRLSAGRVVLATGGLSVPSHGERRRGPAHRTDAGAYGRSDLPGAHAADHEQRGAQGTGRYFADCYGEHVPPRRQGHACPAGRLPLHAQGLQRTGRAEHLARAGAVDVCRRAPAARVRRDGAS